MRFFNSIVQPQLESTDLFTADDNLIFKRRNNFHDNFTQEIRFYLLDGLYTNYRLPVCPEEAVRVQLLAQLIQRQIYNMFFILISYGKGYFIFRIEISNIIHLQRK